MSQSVMFYFPTSHVDALIDNIKIKSIRNASSMMLKTVLQLEKKELYKIMTAVHHAINLVFDIRL